MVSAVASRSIEKLQSADLLMTLHPPITTANLNSSHAHNHLSYQSQLPSNGCSTYNSRFVTLFETPLQSTLFIIHSKGTTSAKFLFALDSFSRILFLTERKESLFPKLLFQLLISHQDNFPHY